jgi:hypothetical protein
LSTESALNRRHNQLVANSASGGTVVMRADSAYYPAAFCGAVRRAGARFSVMVHIDPKIAAAIAAIG